MARTRIPLHLDPNDVTPQAMLRRANHAVDMGQLNPSGFRKPGRHAGVTKRRNQGGAPSLATAHFLAAGVMTEASLRPEKSARRERKERARAAMLEQCRADRRAGRG
jgi:hypothetical protein